MVMGEAGILLVVGAIVGAVRTLRATVWRRASALVEQLMVEV